MEEVADGEWRAANQAHRAPRWALHCVLVVFPPSSLHLPALCRYLAVRNFRHPERAGSQELRQEHPNSLRLALSLADFELIRRLGDGSFAQVCAMSVQVWVSVFFFV